MAKYKVCFSGYAYVEAGSEEDAKDNFWDDMEFYKETSIDTVVDVSDSLEPFEFDKEDDE